MLKKVYQQLVMNSMNSIEQLVQAIEILTKRVDQQDILIKRLDRCCCPSALKCNRHAVQYIDRQYETMRIDDAEKEKKIKIIPQEEYAEFTKDERRLIALKAEREIEKEKKKKEERQREKQRLEEEEKEKRKEKRSISRSIYTPKPPPVVNAQDINSLFRMIQWNKDQEEQKNYNPEQNKTEEYDPEYPSYVHEDEEIISSYQVRDEDNEEGNEDEEGNDDRELGYEPGVMDEKYPELDTVVEEKVVEEKVVEEKVVEEKVDEFKELAESLAFHKRDICEAHVEEKVEEKVDFAVLDTVKKLKEFCKQKGLKNYSRCKTKADFVKFIEDEEKEIHNVMEEKKEEIVEEEVDEFKGLSRDDWMKMHSSKLKEFCKKKGFKGHSKCKTKDDFVKFIMERL
jgi:hypothetical protein